jgi:tRNA A22 N-methylase
VVFPKGEHQGQGRIIQKGLAKLEKERPAVFPAAGMGGENLLELIEDEYAERGFLIRFKRGT